MLVSDKTNLFKITTPELPLGNGVAGTGDMTASIFLSHYLETRDIENSLLSCTASVFGILERSYKNGCAQKSGPLELKIIEAQQELITPAHSFKTEKINNPAFAQARKSV